MAAELMKFCCRPAQVSYVSEQKRAALDGNIHISLRVHCIYIFVILTTLVYYGYIFPNDIIAFPLFVSIQQGYGRMPCILFPKHL